MILCGKQDLLFPPEESIKVLQAIPNSIFFAIEGAAHSIHMENPKAFTDMKSAKSVLKKLQFANCYNLAQSGETPRRTGRSSSGN